MNERNAMPTREHRSRLLFGGMFLFSLFLLFTGTDLFGQASPSAEFARADSLRRYGRIDSAIAIFSRLIVSDPMNSDYFYGRGSSYVMAGKQTEGVKDLRRSLQLDSKCGRCYVWLSRAAGIGGEDRLSALYADSAVIAMPNDALIRQYRGVLRVSLNLPGGVEDLDRSIELDSTIAETYAARASYHLLNGGSAQGLNDIRKAISLDSTLPTPYFYLGQMAAANRKYDEAIAYLTRAISLGYSDPTVYFGRASLEQSTGRLSEALADYSAYIAKVPDDPRAYANMAQVQYRLEEMDGACRTATEGVKHAKGDPEAIAFFNEISSRICNPEKMQYYVQRGVAFYNRNDFAGAIALYDQGLKKFPGSPMLNWTKANAQLASKDWEKAVLSYRTTLASMDRYLQEYGEIGGERVKEVDQKMLKNDLTAGIYNDMVIALLELGKKDQAMKALEDGLAIAPQLSRSRSTLLMIRSDVALKGGDIAAAKKDLETGVTNYPDLVEGYMRLGMIYLNEGEHRVPTTTTETSSWISKTMPNSSLPPSMTIPLSELFVKPTAAPNGPDREALKKSIEYFGKVIERAPNAPAPYLLRSRARFLLNDPAACDDYRMGAELAKGNPNITITGHPDNCGR